MFQLTSPAFRNGTEIPRRHTCNGQGLSPSLQWGEVPPGARSLALVCEDPDAPGGSFHHWAVFDLPPDVRQLAEGVPAREQLPNGARQAENDFGRVGYGAPCPPKGHHAHHYFFRLYALNLSSLPVGACVSCDKVATMAQSHAIGAAELVGVFQR